MQSNLALPYEPLARNSGLKQSKIAAVLLLFLAFIGAAQAQDIIATAGTHWEGFYLLGPRIGYAFDQWLTYFQLGGAFSSGSSNRTFSYTPPSASGQPSPVPLPVFPAATTLNASKDYNSSGWNVGPALDYDISGPWLFTAEYNYVNLGKGHNLNVSCATTRGTVPPTICATYANFELDNIHNSFTMTMFRVGFHYRFYSRRSASQEQL